MELKKGEKIVQEDDVRCAPGTPINTPISELLRTSQALEYWHHGALHLTNQRLILEYYDQGMPFSNLLSNPTKKEVEIPLSALREVGGLLLPSPLGSFAIGYELDSKPQSFFFRPELTSKLNPSDWVNQIEKLPNVKRTDIHDTLKSLRMLSSKDILTILSIWAIIAIIAIILAVVFVVLISMSPYK